MVRLRGTAAARWSLICTAVSVVLGYRVNAFVAEVPAASALSIRPLSSSLQTTRPPSTLRFQPWKEFTEMMQQWDDVIDDFLAKRMGNGEVFYGQRKYKPSNRPNTDGRYNGMGLSDKTKIDFVRDYKEEQLLARQKRRQQQQQQKQQQENNKT